MIDEAMEQDVMMAELHTSVVSEYRRVNGRKHCFAMNHQEMAVFLMEEEGIYARLVTDACWESECCHWGTGVGYTVPEAVFRCYLDYAKELPDHVEIIFP